MFTVIISTAMFEVENNHRIRMLSMSNSTIPGFKSEALAKTAASILVVNILPCERRTWVVQAE